MPLAVGQQVLSSSKVLYETVWTIGSGGNSKTFLVVATNGARKGVPFAMKVFTRQADPERHQGFLKEVEFLKTCDHPSIMRLFDDGLALDRHPFLVAEYLPRTLKDVIVGGSATITEKLSYTVQLLSGLDFLANLRPAAIHRDIKPTNIFLKGHSSVLGDFGLVKRVGATSNDDRNEIKQSGGAGMPTRYRTPDLVEYLNTGRPPTTKSDVFQLGLVAAELFTGKNPQQPGAFSAPVKLNPLAVIDSPLKRPIADLIGRMLEINHEKRDGPSRLIAAWHGLFMTSVRRALANRQKPFS